MGKVLIVLVTLALLTGCADYVTKPMAKGSEIGVVANMRTLHTLQVQYRLEKGRFGTLEELKSAGILNQSFEVGRDYVLTLVSADEKSYALRADPDAENKLNMRHFYIDQSGVLRASMNRPAGPADPPAVM